jgi:hypothetical protein
LKPLREQIERRSNKQKLVQYGHAYIDNVLRDLLAEGAISAEERFDSDLRQSLDAAVSDALAEQLEGDESYQEVQQIVTEVVEDELNITDDEEWNGDDHQENDEEDEE